MQEHKTEELLKYKRVKYFRNVGCFWFEEM